jgi:monoamine oxidase
VIERGAEFVLDGYDALRSLAAREGLELVDTGMSYFVREPRGVPATSADLQAAGTALAGVGGDHSVAELVGGLGLAEAVAEAVLARIEISSAQGVERLAARVLEHVAAFAPLPSHRIGGGNQRLALALARRLGDRVRLATPVRAVEDGVVRTDAGELEAGHVILAVPLPAVAALAPALPAWKRDALARVETGHAAKLHVPLREPPPTSAVMSVPDRFWCWTAESAPGEVAPVANCFAGSPRALAALDVAAGPATWLARLAAVRPELALARDAVLTTWDDDPWAGFAYSADGLTVRAGDDDALAAAVGALHFAGEHTAGTWRALMEGALRSGIRAAEEILA